MARWRRFVRQVPGGAAIASLAATVKRHSDNATVTGGSKTTGANGDFDFKVDGSPDGATYWTATSGTTTKTESGQNHGQIGAMWTDDFPHIFELFGNGVVDGYANEMAASAPGVLDVRIATGFSMVKGIPYRCTANTDLTLSAGDATNPRIDRIVHRVKRPTATNDAAFISGQSTLVVLAGTPAVTPVAPTLTQDANTWEVSLCQIAVAAGASSISAGNITDERGFIGAGLIVQEGDSDVDTGVTTLDFAAADFVVTSSPAGEANVSIEDKFVLTAGDSMTGALAITATSDEALKVEQAAGDDVFLVATDVKNVSLANATDLRVFSDAYTTERARIDGATGNLELFQGADVAFYSDAGITPKLTYDGATGDTEFKGEVFITTDSDEALKIQQADGDDVFLVNTTGRVAAMSGGGQFRIYSDFAYASLKGMWDGADGIFYPSTGTGPSIRSGSADPNGSVTAAAGSIYMRTNGTVLRNTDGGTTWTAM